MYATNLVLLDWTLACDNFTFELGTMHAYNFYIFDMLSNLGFYHETGKCLQKIAQHLCIVFLSNTTIFNRGKRFYPCTWNLIFVSKSSWKYLVRQWLAWPLAQWARELRKLLAQEEDRQVDGVVFVKPCLDALDITFYNLVATWYNLCHLH